MRNLSKSDVTPENLFLNRRKLIKAFGVGAVASAMPLDLFSKDDFRVGLNYKKDTNSNLSLTPENKILGYNNFYEFGLDKDAPSRYKGTFEGKKWNVEIGGDVEKPLVLSIDEILNKFKLEERITSFRCVEAWSMVVPWIGFEFNQILELVRPTSKAKFVEFETVYAPELMPGQKNKLVGGGIDYPYIEGLTIEEAANPLTLIAVGLYGKTLATQSGAPIRLVLPWKYGFKSIKSIVKITFKDTMPKNTWNLLAPDEYGFYANVNPSVDHPRWSQASHRVIGSGGLFSVKREPTLMFNGYEKEVAHLYKDLDLRVNF